MKQKLIIVIILISQISIAQIPTRLGFTLSDKYSEDIAFTKTQEFLLKEILDPSEGIAQFELDRVSSTISGDMTLFNYSHMGKKGLLLAFYGDYWNDAGDIYSGFVFKNLQENKAFDFLNKIERTLTEQKDFLAKDMNNQVAFQFEDLSVIISRGIEFNIKIFWNGFTAEWENLVFKRAKRLMER